MVDPMAGPTADWTVVHWVVSKVAHWAVYSAEETVESKAECWAAEKADQKVEKSVDLTAGPVVAPKAEPRAASKDCC